jgi:hypothetical protein
MTNCGKDTMTVKQSGSSRFYCCETHMNEDYKARKKKKKKKISKSDIGEKE